VFAGGELVVDQFEEVVIRGLVIIGSGLERGPIDVRLSAGRPCVLGCKVRE
jgi:hypothetical protein